MECGGNEACQLVSLLVENGYIGKAFGDWIRDAVLAIPGMSQAVADWISKNLEKILAACGFVFGLWKWWVYREAVLHKRLKEYLERDGKRLTRAREDVISAILRPNGGGVPTQPLYLPNPLKTILRRRKWEPVLNFTGTMHGADSKLNKAEKEIGRRIRMATDCLTLLNQQKASVYAIKGAIASARASRLAGTRQQELDRDALTLFNSVQRVPGHETDRWAKEAEAHQLRRLGSLAGAQLAYEELEAFAGKLLNDRSDRITAARAKRYRAEIRQAQAYPTGSTTAWQMMTASNPANPHYPGALVLRPEPASLEGWDLIEQGEMHLFCALVANRLTFQPSEASHLAKAHAAFDSVAKHNCRRLLFNTEASARLRKAASIGLELVSEAERGHYDVTRLIPAAQHSTQSSTSAATDGVDGANATTSDQPQQPASTVSAPGSDDGVKGTS